MHSLCYNLNIVQFKGKIMTILDNLNEEQRVAAERVDGPVLVLAGAGSGKTRVLTYRIAHMVNELGVPSNSILAITFTNKAANEMKERVFNLIGQNDVWISTFHSFGVRLLKQYIDVIGLDRSFNIYDSDDQKKLVSSIIKRFGIDIKLSASKIISKISSYKESGLRLSEIPVNTSLDRVLVDIYKMYQEDLLKNNALDFADILVYTDRILDNEEILEKVQDRFHYISVDEFQDTNELQMKIVMKLGGKRKNIFVVGDPRQSIYGFRGANINNILGFEGQFGAFKCNLGRNYRSTSNILKASNSVIKNNNSSLGSELWTEESEGEKVFLNQSEDSRKEAKFLVYKIKELLEMGYSYSDITILYRNNFQSREPEEELIRAGIPYRVYGGMQFYQRKEVKDILAYLSFIHNTRDSLSFQRVINTPQRGLGQITVDKVVSLCQQEDIDFLQAIDKAQELDIFSSNIKNSLLSFRDMITNFMEIAKVSSIRDLLNRVAIDSGYNNYLKEAMEEDRLNNVKELINSAAGIDISLSEYLNNISLASSTDELNHRENHVKLMTIHNSKGLEFKVVFIIGLEEELFPHSNSVMSNNIEEERRLFYVGMTRAKEMLILSYAKSRAVYNASSTFRERSRFVDEIPEMLLEIKLTEKVNDRKSSEVLFKAIEDMKKRKEENKRKIAEINKAQIVRLQKIVGFSLGDKVAHKVFGKGKVTSLSLDKIVILFDEVGEKKFVSSTASKFILKI